MNNEEARDLHKQSLVIDGHNDSIVAMIRSGNRNIDGTLKPNWHEHEGAVAYLRQYYADPEQKLLQLVPLKKELQDCKKGKLHLTIQMYDVPKQMVLSECAKYHLQHKGSLAKCGHQLNLQGY